MPNSMSLQVRPDAPVLMIWPSVSAWRVDGRLWLDRKFKDGMDAWCRHWPGRVRVVMEAMDLSELSPFGAWAWDAEAAGFALEVLEPGQRLAVEQLRDVQVLLASADDYRQLHVAALCEKTGTRCIYAIEYTLRTRIDLTRHSTAPWIRRAKNIIWHLRNEVRVSRSIRRAHGLQANGIPAYRAYRRSTDSSQLYFDTRLRQDAVIAKAALDARLEELRRRAPLRLAFSGRLIAAKGGDALIPLARELRARGVPFAFDIYGAGELSQHIARGIAEHGLQECVRLRGAVDFDDVLVPTLKQGVDLFICCHRQGDPSCTYAETLGCGVPIAGFANESLLSLVEAHDVGWTVPMGDVRALAALVADLDASRDRIAVKSDAAMRFGELHHFESTFDIRARHCVSALAPSRPDSLLNHAST